MRESIYLAALRPPQAGMFELFAVNDPIRELQHILLYIVLPVVIGAILTCLAIRTWAKWTGRQARFSPWPVAVMVAMLLSTIYVFAAFVFAFIAMHQTIRVEKILVDLVLALLLTAPTLLVLGPIFGIYVFLSRRSVRLLPDGAVYAISATCLAAEYFWVGYVLSR